MEPQTRYRYQQLYRVTNGHVPSRDPNLHSDFNVVIGAIEDPSTVEAALGLWVFGRKLIGVNRTDGLETAGDGVGRARVVSRNTDLEHDLASMLADLIARGFGDGFVLLQMLSFRDGHQPTVQDLADIVQKVFAGVDGPVHYTMVPQWASDVIVLIGVRWQLQPLQAGRGLRKLTVAADGSSYCFPRTLGGYASGAIFRVAFACMARSARPFSDLSAAQLQSAALILVRNPSTSRSLTCSNHSNQQSGGSALAPRDFERRAISSA